MGFTEEEPRIFSTQISIGEGKFHIREYAINRDEGKLTKQLKSGEHLFFESTRAPDNYYAQASDGKVIHITPQNISDFNFVLQQS